MTTMDDKTSGAVNWLLCSAEPAVRMLARRDLLGQDIAHAGDVLAGPKVEALLSGQHEDGGFGVHPYRKWTGARWRLVSLVELGIPAGEPRALRAAGCMGCLHGASPKCQAGSARRQVGPSIAIYGLDLRRLWPRRDLWLW